MSKYVMNECDQFYRLKTEHAKKYKSLCKQMQKLLDDIKVYEPDVNIYVEDSDNWNLIFGETHDKQGHARTDRVAAHCTVSSSSGGGW